MSWDEAFANHYEAMVGPHDGRRSPSTSSSPARRTGRWSSWRSGTGGWRSRSRRRPASGSSASTRRRQCWRKPAPVPPTAGVELDLQRGRHARPRPRRAGGADLLPVRPRLLHLPTWADRRGTYRARRRLSPAGRAVRLERSCFRPPDRRAPRRRAPGGADSAHDPVRRGRQPDRHRPRRRRDELPLVGDEERVARAPRVAGAPRRGRPRGGRSTAASPASRSATTAGNTCSSPALGSRVTLPTPAAPPASTETPK